MKKYKGKYRIDSIRAQWWDYGWNGAYYITICTKNRKHFFGKIRNGKMILSHLGVIVDVLWHEIPNHAKHLKLGEFVVMPNHLHGILIIDAPDDNDTGDMVIYDGIIDDRVIGEPVIGDPVIGDPVIGDPVIGDPVIGDPVDRACPVSTGIIIH